MATRSTMATAPSEPRSQSEMEPPLYSAEWFRWVEGKYLDPDDPPVRYTKTAKK